MDDDEFREIVFGDFNSALEMFRSISYKHRLDRATPDQFSFEEARRFSDGLILAADISQVHDLVRANPIGAVSFYEFAHEAEDRHRFEQLDFISHSDGRHEPFLLLASATRNLMDAWDEESP